MARDWDAATYQRVSEPQLAWGREVLDRLELRGDETVLDAGCGTGRVTELLRERVPDGRVVGVDASASMIAKARENLGPDVELHVMDLLELDLPEPVDVVFSTATFHWVLDHDRLFERIEAVLAPGGRLHAQCGGHGNVARFTAMALAIAAEEGYAQHVPDLEAMRYFATPEETAERLRRVGMTDIACGLEPRPAHPPEPREFLRAVCLGGVLEALPAELGEAFLDEVTARFEAEGGELDYVRLNIAARKP
jgi:trans-aconitate 2-methyltransferase